MIDPKVQLQILECLRAAFPNRVDTRSMNFSEHVPTNVRYLEEHGLVDAKWGGNFAVGNVKITARGMDHIADDGGLTAALGVVTIKLHPDTIKDLLIAQVDASHHPETVKSKLKAKIRELPAKGVDMVATEAVKLGLKHAPDAVHWLTNLLSQMGGPPA